RRTDAVDRTPGEAGSGLGHAAGTSPLQPEAALRLECRTGMSLPVARPIESELYARRWWALAVLCLSLLIVFVGNSSLNVAIPTLSRELHATESQLQWVVAVYSLVFAGLLFSTGALGDKFG